jgi:hypothetical protein
LNGSDHASPSVVAFDLLDAFAVGEPEDVAEVVEELMGVIVGVLLAEEL